MTIVSFSCQWCKLLYMMINAHYECSEREGKGTRLLLLLFHAVIWCLTATSRRRWICLTSNWAPLKSCWWTNCQKTLTKSGPKTGSSRAGPTASSRWESMLGYTALPQSAGASNRNAGSLALSQSQRLSRSLCRMWRARETLVWSRTRYSTSAPRNRTATAFGKPSARWSDTGSPWSRRTRTPVRASALCTPYTWQTIRSHGSNITWIFATSQFFTCCFYFSNYLNFIYHILFLCLIYSIIDFRFFFQIYKCLPLNYFSAIFIFVFNSQFLGDFFLFF